MTAEYHVQTVVAGSGVVGLAIARRLARAGHEVLILEAEDSGAHHTSARNSQVIHAGMYYPTGSLKARLCVEGNRRLYNFCATRHVDHDQIEKLIVATDPSQLPAMQALHDRGHANGLTDLTLLAAEDAMRWEPQLSCHGAIHSPSTGIVDAAAFMAALRGEAEAEGAAVALKSPLKRVTIGNTAFGLEIGDAANTHISCTNLINAAGHGAWDIARSTHGYDPHDVPPQHPAKGCYVSLAQGKAPFERLIYPMPEPGFLGVHYVRDTGGRVTFGPNLIPMDETELDYSNDPSFTKDFERTIRTFWPGLPDNALQPDTCGIRPRITAPGEPLADFRVLGPVDHGVRGLVQLFGIESPGLTASLALAAHVARLI